MRLWKRLLGTALCLCAAVCLMSVSASAAEHSNHPICGAAHTDIGDHTGACGDVTWTAWNGTDDITYDADTKTAYVYLASDATRNNHLIVKTGCTLYLCLNGNSLTSSVTSSSDMKNSEVINVPNNAKFILCDCKDSGPMYSSFSASSLTRPMQKEKECGLARIATLPPHFPCTAERSAAIMPMRNAGGLVVQV